MSKYNRIIKNTLLGGPLVGMEMEKGIIYCIMCLFGLGGFMGFWERLEGFFFVLNSGKGRIREFEGQRQPFH